MVSMKEPYEKGTSAILLQSGLDEKRWADSVECCGYLRNVQDLLVVGTTPYERRHGEPYKGPIIPFGALVEYHPISPRDQARIHQFGKKVLPGIFLRYELIAVRFWKGDILIADLKDLEKLDASEVHPRRINAKRSIDATKERQITYSQKQTEQQNCQEGTTISENPL